MNVKNYLIQRLSIKESRIPIICGVGYVETAKYFDGGVLSKERIVDTVLGNWTAIGLSPLPSKVVAIAVAKWRLNKRKQISSGIY